MQNSDTSVKIPWKGMIVGLGTAVVALVVVFMKVADPIEVLRELQTYPIVNFFAALAAVVGAWGVDGVRMRVLTQGAGVVVPSWWTLAVTLIASNFLTLVTPFAVGGGPLVVYMLYRMGMSVAQATAVVTAGGFAAQAGLSILASLVLSLMTTVPPDVVEFFVYVRIGFLVYFLIVAILALLTLLGKHVQRAFNKRPVAAEWIAEFNETYRRMFSKGMYSAKAMVAGFAYYALYYLAGYFLLGGFGVGNRMLRYGVSVLLGVAPIISPIPGGAGAAELVAYHVLNEYLPDDALGTFIVLWRSVVFYIPIVVGGAIFVFLVLKWAGTNDKDIPESVILPDENDHNR